MESLYCVRFDAGTLMQIKVADRVMAIPVFRKSESALKFIENQISEHSRRECQISDFSLVLFDRERESADKADLDLLLHVSD